MTAPLISIVVPTFNRARYIAEAVASVRAQRYTPLELIVVDDGSTDETPQILQQLAGDDMRCLRQDNHGLPAARNAGIRESNGVFLAFLDDDDVWLADKLQRQMAVFEKAPKTDAVYGHAQQFISPDLNASERSPLEHLDGRVVAAPISPTLLIRRAAFDRVGPFDETLSFGIEMDWYGRLCDQSLCVTMLDAVVYHRRLHRSNMNRATNGEQSERLRVLKQMLDRRRSTNAISISSAERKRWI